MGEISDITDEADNVIINSNLSDKDKEFMFDMIKDVQDMIVNWNEFLATSTHQQLIGFLGLYREWLHNYWEQILAPMGIDYFDAPFMIHYFNVSMGNDLRKKYKEIGEEE